MYHRRAHAYQKFCRAKKFNFFEFQTRIETTKLYDTPRCVIGVQIRVKHSPKKIVSDVPKCVHVEGQPS